MEVLDKNVLSYYAPRIRKKLGNLICKLNKIEEMKDNKRGVPQETFDKVEKIKKNLNDKICTWVKRGGTNDPIYGAP
jgi:iron-sulfur cluster repair protein YtfE (RIC family)